MGEVDQQIIRHAIGARAQYKSVHERVGERLFVFFDQAFGRAVCVGVGLEIGEVTHRFIFPTEKGDALFQLLGDGLAGLAVVWVKGVVVAKGTTSCGDLAVAVGTRKAAVDGYLLHFMLKNSV